MNKKDKIQRALDALPQTTPGDWWVGDNDWALHNDPMGSVKVARDISGLTKEERKANWRVIETSRELAQEVLDLRNKLNVADGPREFRVVETDNFDGDYPDESFASGLVTEKGAGLIADIMNQCWSGPSASRFYKVEKDTFENPYKLQPGFEP